jgi:hypothetical protein
MATLSLVSLFPPADLRNGNIIDSILFLAGDEKNHVGDPTGEMAIIVMGTVESQNRAGLEMKIMATLRS